MDKATFIKLDTLEQKRLTDATMNHVLTGTRFPGSLASYPNREKTLVNKLSDISGTTNHPQQVVNEVQTTINQKGKSWYCIDAANNWNRLINTEYLLLVTKAAPLMECTIAPNANLIPTNQMSQQDLANIAADIPSVLNYVQTSGKSVLWFEVVSYKLPDDPDFVPPHERIVVSSGNAFDLKCRAATITCI